jgi:hypothetical protein
LTQKHPPASGHLHTHIRSGGCVHVERQSAPPAGAVRTDQIRRAHVQIVCTTLGRQSRHSRTAGRDPPRSRRRCHAGAAAAADPPDRSTAVPEPALPPEGLTSNSDLTAIETEARTPASRGPTGVSPNPENVCGHRTRHIAHARRLGSALGGPVELFHRSVSCSCSNSPATRTECSLPAKWA